MACFGRDGFFFIITNSTWLKIGDNSKTVFLVVVDSLSSASLSVLFPSPPLLTQLVVAT